ncbi:hypothetical protein Fmac_007817 [Flemingia macrophylla]|uniref:FLZ-type domain-containing protein n=1 Tax=Flemingia macrophylla TaxID=520843 RepID=A0ABD1MVN7_9FABA
MMLGKRPQVKRTTSMTEITFDLNTPFDDHAMGPCSPHQTRNHTHFLRACFLCKRRLVPGRDDIYIYRGESAFCSSECREKQMKHDERKEKCAVAVAVPSKKQVSTKGETLLSL